MVLPLLVVVAVGAAAASASKQARAGDHSADIDGSSLTAEQIYWRIRNGPGNGDLLGAQEELTRLEERYSTRDGQLRSLVAKLDAAWQGDAAGSAVAHVTLLDQAFQESVSSLRELKEAVRDQIEAFSRIYHAVEEVPAEPPQSGIINDVNPFTTDTDRAIDAYNQKAAANVARYESYNRDSATNGDRMPTAYPTLPLDVPSISVSDSSADRQDGTFATDGVTNASAATPADTAVPRQNVPNAGQAVPSPDLRGEGLAVAPPGSRTGDSRTGDGSTRPNRVATTLPSNVGDANAPTRNPSEPGPMAGSVQPGAGGPAARWTGGGAGRGASGGPGRVVGGSGGPGRVVGGSGNANGRQDAANPLGRGPASGAADTSAVPRRGATPVGGATAATGTGGAPYGMPPATPRDDDDTEHRSVLLQPDPHELFGLEDLTPPAVIGEDEDV